jgi:hypothetical protein
MMMQGSWISLVIESLSVGLHYMRTESLADLEVPGDVSEAQWGKLACQQEPHGEWAKSLVLGDLDSAPAYPTLHVPSNERLHDRDFA